MDILESFTGKENFVRSRENSLVNGSYTDINGLGHRFA